MKHTTSFDYMLHFIISSIDLFGFSGKNDITDLRLWNLFISRVCSWSVNKHCTLKTIKSFFFFSFHFGMVSFFCVLLKKKNSHTVENELQPRRLKLHYLLCYPSVGGNVTPLWPQLKHIPNTSWQLTQENKQKTNHISFTL